MIRVTTNQDQVLEYNKIIFSGGEIHVRFEDFQVTKGPVLITAQLYSSNDILELLMVTDALRRLGVSEIELLCPYLPYARQDRVCNPGEALSLRVIADLLNSQNYSSVTTWDVHSDASRIVIDGHKDRYQSSFISSFLKRSGRRMTLVAPDAGALKKTIDVSRRFDVPFIQANKIRNPVTGEITGTTVNVQTYNNHFLIVDDICDGGRTFIQLARQLRLSLYKTRSVSLYVTHGIFSKGLDVFEGLLDKIYCPHVWPDIKDHKLLERI